MRSHLYEFSWRQLAWCLAPTLVCLMGLAAILHVEDALELLPAPAIERGTIPSSIVHQSRTCRGKSQAQIVLVGDSTCHMGVDALELSRQLPARPIVLNLALTIQYDLAIYAEEVTDFAKANSGQLRAVILLVTPDKLGGKGLGEYTQVWEMVHHAASSGSRPPCTAVITDPFGAQRCRENLLSHLLSAPYLGVGADFYGFSSEFDRYMDRHFGSVVACGELSRSRLRFRSLADFVMPFPLLGPIEAQSRAFHASLPQKVKLFVGLTPLPAWSALPLAAARQQQRELLERWNDSIQADVLLTNLPATLPYGYFGPLEHLNLMGQKYFTAKLAKEVATHLP